MCLGLKALTYLPRPTFRDSLYVQVIYAQNQEPITMEDGSAAQRACMSINVDIVASEGRWKGSEQLVQELHVRCTKVNLLN